MELSPYNTVLDSRPLLRQLVNGSQRHDYPEAPQTQDSDEVRDADLIDLFNTDILPRWQQKYKLSDTSLKTLQFTVNNFLDDSSFLRISSAMGNEAAVALEESMKQWGFPKWLSNTLYYGFWAAAIGSSAARIVLRGLGTSNIKTFLETTIQDAVAAFIGPTGIIIAADKLQNMIYKRIKVLPQSLVSFVRPLASVYLAQKSITGILDPIGKSLGRALTGMVSPQRYKRWSDSIATKLQAMLGARTR